MLTFVGKQSQSVGNIVFSMASSLKSKLGFGKQDVRRIQILRDFEGLVKPGEMLVVLGRPGRFVTPTCMLPGVPRKLITCPFMFTVAVRHS